jgi:hypothetical protein
MRGDGGEAKCGFFDFKIALISYFASSELIQSVNFFSDAQKRPIVLDSIYLLNNNSVLYI